MMPTQTPFNGVTAIPYDPSNPGNLSGTPIVNPSGQNSFNSALSNAQNAASGTQPQQPQQQAPPQKGNWLTHMLPTLGSFLGNAAPLIGGALLAPETGGTSLMAALALRTALAGAGSAAGKGLENVIQGTPQTASGLLTSAAEGAGGQLAGEGIAKAVGGVGGAIKGALGNAVAGHEAAQTAIQDLTPYAAVAKGQDVAGMQNLFKNQLGVNDISPANVHKVISMLTGGGANDTPDFINATKNALVAGAGPVNITGISNVLKNSINNESNIAALGNAEAKGSAGNGLYNSLMAKTQSLYGPEGSATISNGTSSASIDTLVHPTAVQDAIQSTRNSLDNVNTNTDSGQATANVLNDYRNALTTALGKSSGLNQAISNYTVPAEDAAAFRNAVTSAGLPSQVADYGINALNNAKTYSDITGAEVPLVKAGQLASAADKYAAGPGIIKETTANAPSNAALKIADMASLGLAVPTGGASLLGMLPHVIKAAKNPDTLEMGNKLLNSGASKSLAKLLPGVLTGASQFITHAPDQTATPVNLNIGSNNMNPNAIPTVDPNSLTAHLLAYYAAQGALPGGAGAGTTGLNNVATGLNNVSAVQQALTGAENQFQQAGGGQGGVMGNLQKFFGGITGSPASQYDATRQQLQSLLTGTTGAPGMAPGSAVPDITGNNLSAQQQFQVLQDIINSRMQGGAVLAGLPTGQ